MITVKKRFGKGGSLEFFMKMRTLMTQAFVTFTRPRVPRENHT